MKIKGMINNVTAGADPSVVINEALRSQKTIQVAGRELADILSKKEKH